MVPPQSASIRFGGKRVNREMAKRMLCVFNVWKVRSLQFQLTTVQRKRKLAEGLYTETNEEEPIFPRS